MKIIRYKYRNLVGENLRRIRKERGLTQEELALMSGLSQGYINQLESGKRKFTQKTLTVIAEALGLPLIIFFAEPPATPPGWDSDPPYPSSERPNALEVLQVLESLPPHVAAHYLTLMSLEKRLYEEKKSA
ncbi:MAG: helix-turn-helix transcriptional regulator [Nitrospirae bacterium]|nr:helix-turn-helix transcriptional regulator [Nitrospirota bacterium]